MATVEAMQPQSHADRPRRSRPFSSWVRKLTNFKNSSSTLDSSSQNTKRASYQMRRQAKKNVSKNNNPYMSAVQGHASSSSPVDGRHSVSTMPTGTASMSSIERSRRSSDCRTDRGIRAPRSVAPTISTTAEHEHAHYEMAQSHAASSGAGTTATMGHNGRGADSTFSSPAPSVRSLTTTLTTIQSANTPLGTTSSNHNQAGLQNTNIPFAHQYPTSPHPTAIPAHLATNTSGGHPSTYNTATANNLLTDNASILTLASSSKRRRRRSMDTDASVRALAPSSIFGGSRESLPLSVLSTNMEGSTLSPGLYPSRQSISGLAERASIYSATGVVPALPSDRNSYYAARERTLGDGVSVKSGKSGFYGHGRTESLSGSVGVLGPGIATSPLASPNLPSTREMPTTTERLSRTNSRRDEASGDETAQDHILELEKCRNVEDADASKS